MIFDPAPKESKGDFFNREEEIGDCQLKATHDAIHLSE
jgi:hypothetical protein